MKTIETVNLSKGIGVLLVVWSHFYSDNVPDYWIHLQKVVFKFYIPLFFVVSGYLLGKNGLQITSLRDFFQLIRKLRIIPS